MKRLKTHTISSYKAFTLVEIMIVILIISIVLSIALPNIRRAHEGATFTKHKKQLLNMCNAVEQYQADTGSFPGNITSLTSATPPYIHPSIAAKYCGQSTEGFTFLCSIDATYAFLFRADDSQTSSIRYSCQRSRTTGAWVVTDNPPF